jgi:hydroxypyruvate isomerase
MFMRFSANLGFLFTELALPDAIAVAALHFDAVECHFPYAVSTHDVARALEHANLPMISINTVRGRAEAGEFGLAALPGREADARAAIDQAIDYATAVGARAVHVMAGRSGGGVDAQRAFEGNLSYACASAAESQTMILIEPINQRDVPGYHLATLDAAIDTIERVDAGCLKIMFDFYHVQIIQGDVLRAFELHRDVIGHVQIAAVPDRGAPDHGDIDYIEVLQAVQAMGYAGHVGAEYRPRGPTNDDLAWLPAIREHLEQCGR